MAPAIRSPSRRASVIFVTGATHTCTKSTIEPSSVEISTALAPALRATSAPSSTATTSGAALSRRRFGVVVPASSVLASG